MNQHEPTAAEVAGARKSDGKREADCDRCVDGAPPTPQDVEPDARRRRFLGHNHAMLGDHRTRGGQWRDDRVGYGRSLREAKTSERGELKWPQSWVLETWLTR